MEVVPMQRHFLENHRKTDPNPKQEPRPSMIIDRRDFYFSDSASSVSDCYRQREGDPSIAAENQRNISYAATKNVNRLKFIVGATTVVSMMFISLAIFFMTREIELIAFEDSYKEASHKVLDAIGVSIDLNLAAMDSFAATLISLSRASNQTWPFVIVPDFAFRAGKIRAMTRCAFLNVYPAVHDTERDQWESFTAQTSSWVQSDIEVMKTDPNYFGQSEGEYELWDVIHDNSEYDKEEQDVGTVGSLEKDIYFPMWQQYPIAPYAFPPYNWDLHSGGDDSEAVTAFFQRHQTIMTPPYPLPNVTDQEDVEADMYEAEWLSGFLRPEDNEFEPVADIYFPIYDISTEAQLQPTMRSNSTFKGLLSFTFRWRELIVDILPPSDESAVIVVFESSCAPSFTYEVDGGSVNYLGSGDQHASKFDDMVLTASLVNLDQYATRERSYTGVPINDVYCPMTIRTFPTSQMENHFVSKTPILYALCAFTIFGVTALTFAMYSFFVERRQRIVLKAAEQSGQVVSNLFPSAVRDRVVQDVTLESVSSRSDRQLMEVNSGCSEKAGRPIADEYAECTILFMDIAGFTSWSSRRTPEQVFLLLETLYGTFDKVARQIGVFKVETIGDSYMAATGVPQPTKSHASKMVRFASLCRNAARARTRVLAETLGPDTADLKLRIGINSGTVTAGVLRGDRSRFQLFGDTVNTASRMESTGVVDRIQVSQMTADFLVEEGKVSWLLAREDRVQAKGKGKLQTYFAVNRSLTSDRYPWCTDVELGDDAEESNRLVGWIFTLFNKTFTEHASRQMSSPREPSSLDDKLTHALPSRSLDYDVYEAPSGELPVSISNQLRQFIQTTADLHKPSSPFHNFEHTSYVTLTFIKMWDRLSDKCSSRWCSLTKLACMFGILVHEIEHSSFSDRGSDQVERHDNKLETRIQTHSVIKAWNLLMGESYRDLRSLLFSSHEEQNHFHQVFTSVIMASNASNGKSNRLHEKRRVESSSLPVFVTSEQEANCISAEETNRTLTIELMIKASLMGHTMHHWNIYLKWTKRSFRESLKLQDGNRVIRHAELFTKWLENEKKMFGSTAVPLAQQLVDSHMFDASEDFLLNAKDNARQLEQRADSLVQLFLDCKGTSQEVAVAV